MSQFEVNQFLARQRNATVTRVIYGQDGSPVGLAHHATCEATLHDEILDECRRRGWIALHSRMDMRATITVGAPDFTILADAGRVLLVECKTATGKLRPEQAALHAWAAQLGHTVHVVRNLDEFIALL